MDELLAVFSLPKFALPPVAEVAISMGFGSSLPLLRLASLAREVEGDFPARDERRRRWFAPQEAARMVAESGLKHILTGLPAMQGPQY